MCMYDKFWSVPLNQKTYPGTYLEYLAENRLTALQHIGGLGLTASDHVRIGEVLSKVFGDYIFVAPPVCTAQWGFVAWAKFIGKI